ncbi:MAG: hypothetical protein M3011_06555 [Actinomycetota bacterium]|nr:hypothetical protein [Actinomycetota bacterium]
MQIVARPSVGGRARYLARVSRPKLNWVRFVSSRPSAEDTEGPTVVAVDDNRRETVMQRPGTFGQARRAARRMQCELDAVGRTEFTRRYGLHLR